MRRFARRARFEHQHILELRRAQRVYGVMEFEVSGSIDDVEAIARGAGVKIRAYLRQAYGRGRWRKLKGIATVRLPNGAQHKVELHWYEAHGIGRRDLKIKRYLDDL